MSNPVYERNPEVFWRINAEALQNPQSPYANKFVGIANGQVVVVADTFDDMNRRLLEIEPDTHNILRLEASRDYDDPEHAYSFPFYVPRPKAGPRVCPYSSNPMFEVNRQLAMKINAEALQNPQSPYANKWVGIANGQVAVVADTLDEMYHRLSEIEPDPSSTMGIEASRDYSEPVYIWSLR
jgi:hypothetical protein